MDIGIILDSSTSVGLENWKGTLKFVKRLSQNFIIGPKHTIFGVIQFRHRPKMIFDLKEQEYWTKQGFEDRVMSIRYRRG